ncbi:MAG: methionine ABC transporter ATP-binding protein [Microbacterium sp. 69-10]|uniref:ABC transporter ATP-binding protein n=1 Tax=Microbacterium sp. 69-10 TaxID=1895783 RepID=UPI0009652D73|nr:ABC transporter ATP-binding protein [Microbacterium sp. 69-10]OJU41286.1 MAG: methionine ABC transporter ATP-binding protein [Microbacterium sp. 69-10]
MAGENLLEIEDLSIGIKRGGRQVRIAEDVNLTVGVGERVGLVGESGAGKSMVLRAIAGLLPRGVEVLSGAIRYDGKNLLDLRPSQRLRLMGPEIAMVFQEPMTALNPLMRVGEQIAEASIRYKGMSRRAALARAVELMSYVGIPDPKTRATAFPHELSGGLRQRVMIAMAISLKPRLLLCDEPTTALDVTVQHQVLRLLEEMCDEVGAALLFVTHDLAVINQTCRRLAVMYAGHVIETGTTEQVLHDPRHPYTRGLLESAPDFDRPERLLAAIPGSAPNLADRQPGCAFAPRCRDAVESCFAGEPTLHATIDGRQTACFRADELFQKVNA